MKSKYLGKLLVTNVLTVEILSLDFTSLHWYLAIITNPGLLLEQGLTTESTESSPGGDVELSPLVGSKQPVSTQPNDKKEIGTLASPADSMTNEKTSNGESETSNHASPASSSLLDSPKLSRESRKNKNEGTSPSDGLDERLQSRRKLRSASAIPLDPDAR